MFRFRRGLNFAFFTLVAGCHTTFSPGLVTDFDGAADDPDGGSIGAGTSGAADAADTAGASSDTTPAAPDLGPPPILTGEPEVLGCADGTREGFLDAMAWPDIGGCSGAWDVPGVLGEIGRTPMCARSAGNTGSNGQGMGCSVADLCAQGWHVCADPEEVARRSPTDCESAAPSAHPIFFLVTAGASPLGICKADRASTNDIHGCGNLGQPESEGCQPLERRMGFADCLGTNQVWKCGTAEDHLREATVVVKTGPAWGGALCCRD